MTQLDNKLSELFDVQPIKSSTDIIEVEVNDVQEDTVPSDIETDFSIASNNIKSLLEKGDTAIDKLILVADQSEHPRAYEVVSTMMKTMADLNKDLLDLQKRRKELTNKGFTNDNKPINVDKAVFVGSTKDLITMIKNNKEENGTTN